MTLHRMRMIGLVLTVGLVLAACGGSGGSTAPTAGADAADLQALSASSAAGEALFTSAGCIDCHAVTADGMVPEGGTNLAGFWSGNGIYQGVMGNFKPIDDANVSEYIREGGVGKVGKMPAHAELTDEQLQQLVDYLKTLDA